MSALPVATTVDDPMTPVGARLVATASRLFYDHGIRAVGVERIAEDAETTKKTLYDRFGSKDALVVLYLRGRAARWQSTALDRLAAHPEPGRDRVLVVSPSSGDATTATSSGCSAATSAAVPGGTPMPTPVTTPPR